jgi:hypothetical protein
VFDASITDLSAALSARTKILDADLERLGMQRAKAVQDALLGSGDIDPARVFLIAQSAAPPADKRVRLEMSLK